MRPIPGIAIRRRPCHVVWILDSSSSMVVDGKLCALNSFIRETIPYLNELNEEYPNIEIRMSAVTYGTGARWHLEPQPIDHLVWPDIFDFGRADAAQAFQLVEGRLRRWWDECGRQVPPFLIWVAGSQLTGAWSSELDHLLSVSRRLHAKRLAVLVGQDAPYSVLNKFIDEAGVKPLLAGNPEILLRYMRIQDDEVLCTYDEQADVPTVLDLSAIPIPIAGDDETDSSDVW